MNTPFFQVRTREFGHGAGNRAQGLDLVLQHKSGHRVRRSLRAHNFCKFRAVQCFFLAAKLMFQIKWRRTGRNGVTMYTVTYRVLKVSPQHHFVPVLSHQVRTAHSHGGTMSSNKRRPHWIGKQRNLLQFISLLLL